MGLFDRIRLLDPRPLKGPTLAHLKKVEDENALLRQHAAKQITDATLMTGLHVDDDGMEIGLKGGAAGLLAEQLAKQFIDSGAKNFLELTFRSAEMAPGEQFVVTIQRVGGETPGAQLKRLKAELSAKPFGYWHQGATEEESDFFKASDFGEVGCATCIALYEHLPSKQVVEGSIPSGQANPLSNQSEVL